MRTIDTRHFRRGYATEDALNQTVNERELTIYAEVVDIDQVEAAAAERKRIEQWDLPTKSDVGRLRICKIDNVQMILTSKTFEEGVFGAMEHNTAIIQGQWDNLRKMAVNGHYKTRLIIPFVEHPYRWEVDLYFSNKGGISKWVKIDLEDFDLDKEIPEMLPFDCKQIILSDDPNLGEADKRIIESLWEEEWNKILK